MDLNPSILSTEKTLPLSSKLLKTLALAALLAPFVCAAAEKRKAPEPDPGWIGDCYYYADGGYYHKDGVYWRADLKTHYVYEEECWHLANGGILTGTGVYFPPVAAPDGLIGIPWRLAAVVTALIAGPPQNPGTPPEKPAARVVIEVRSSSDR